MSKLFPNPLFQNLTSLRKVHREVNPEEAETDLQQQRENSTIAMDRSILIMERLLHLHLL